MSRVRPLPSVAAIRRAVAYEPKTGAFRWKQDRGPVRAGDRAGYLDCGGYLVIRISGADLKAHRVAWALMTGRWPRLALDHADGRRGNNRWANLRLATTAQNGANRQAANINKLTRGARGVWLAPSGQWRARVSTSFTAPTKALALAARERAMRMLHGAFAGAAR